jgi:RimJ/RimL family protein N-acetyltransferase
VTEELLPVLHGARVRLRAQRASDVAALFALYADARVMRYWSNAPFTRMEQAQEKFEYHDRGVRAGEFLQWAIVRSDDGLIGTCSLFELNPTHRRASFGYALASAHWGHGYALEATRLVVDYAFGVMALRRLEADVDPRNAPSLRLLERLGFRSEGVLRERWQVSGETQDSAIYGLLSRDYAATASSRASALGAEPA